MLQPGQPRLEVGLSAVGLQVSHLASCPEVAPAECATEDVPEHRHALTITWTRLQVGAALGLGSGLYLALEQPFDLRVIDASYTTLDGQPYDPPYEDIHHRDETLVGPADGQLTLNGYRALGRTVVGGALGGTLPFGHTEEDPFEAAERGEWHRHQQLGAGLPLVVGSASAVVRGRWGALFGVGGRVPVAENAKGYRAPLTLTGSAGPTFKASPRLQLLASGEFVFEGAEHWHGVVHGGRRAALVDLGAQWAFDKDLVGLVELRAPAWQALVLQDDEDGTFRELPLLRLGLSWTGRARSPTE